MECMQKSPTSEPGLTRLWLPMEELSYVPKSQVICAQNLLKGWLFWFQVEICSLTFNTGEWHKAMMETEGQRPQNGER